MSNADQLLVLATKAAKCINKDATDVRYDASVPGNTVIMSNTFGVTIEFKTKKGIEKHKVIVKIPPKDRPNFELFIDQQFHNEILFYRTFGRDCKDFPKAIYIEENAENSVIILENMNTRGFKLLPEKFNAPLDHVIAVMRGIGRFHAKAYVMKEFRREEFLKIIGDIQEARYQEEEGSHFEMFTNTVSTAIIKSLRARNYDKAFCDEMEKFLENAYRNIMLSSTKPVEPLATLCHSDLTLNNILFGEENGEVRPVFIDFGLIRYTSPGIDLSTFTYLCCSNEIRKEKLSDIFRAYHDELKKYLIEGGIQDLEKYSYEALFEEYKRRVLFGYIIASFYLTTLTGQNTMSLSEVNELDTEECGYLCTAWSTSEEDSKVFVDMFLDIKDLGGMDHIL